MDGNPRSPLGSADLPRERATTPPRLRVVFATFVPTMPGGIPTAELPIHRALEASGAVDVIAIPFGRRSPEESRLRRYVTRVLDLVRYAFLVLRRRPDLVQFDTSLNGRALIRDLAYVTISRAMGQPVFLKMHGTRRPLLRTRSPLMRWLLATVLRGATGIGVLSAEERNAFADAGFDAGRLHVVPNAVDASRFAEATWPRPGPARLLFIARLVTGKGLEDVLDAVACLRGAGREVRLVCVGDGPERAAAERRAGELGIADAVTFTGAVSEAEATRHYLEATALVHPSHRESFSMTIFQSLAAGLPIVTTRIGAAADHLNEPENCLWAPAGDPARLAERLGWLLDHPEVQAAMSRANRERAQRFLPEAVVPLYVDLYRRLGRSASQSA